MTQITEDFVSFETARLLKEKGFDIYVPSFYDVLGEFNRKVAYWNWNAGNHYSAPTLQMAMKWLRKVHNQIIVPGISLDDRTSSVINHYFVGIWYVPKNNGGAFCYTSPTPYNGCPSFEEACEDGIRYCLKHLI